MYFRIEDLIKVIVLINAKNDGWNVLCEDINTFYIYRKKSNKYNFKKEMINLCKKPLNLEKVLNEINNGKNL